MCKFLCIVDETCKRCINMSYVRDIYIPKGNYSLVIYLQNSERIALTYPSREAQEDIVKQIFSDCEVVVL